MRNRNRRLSLAAFVTALLFALPTGTATAADAVAGTGTTTATTTATTPSADSAALASKRLGITMQAQQKTNWCWAASGNTIATWFGRNYSQNQFCNAAFNRQQGYDCPNNQASLANVQTALRWAASTPAPT